MTFVSIINIFVSRVSDFVGLPSQSDFLVIPMTFGHYTSPRSLIGLTPSNSTS